MALKDCHNFWNYSRIYIQYNILDAPKWPYAQPEKKEILSPKKNNF